MKKILFFYFYVCTTSILECKVLPERLATPCPKSTPKYDKCIVEVLTKWIPYLIEGVEEIKFPKLSPFYVPIIAVNKSLSNDVTVSAVLKDIKVKGFETASIQNCHFDTDAYNGDMHVHISRLIGNLDYDVVGNLQGVRLGNVGHFTGEATDMDIYVKFQLELVDKLGVNHFQFTDYKIKVAVGNATVKLTSKDLAAQSLADFLANLFNKNPKQSIEMLLPIIIDVFESATKDVIGEVLDTVPANEIIPE